MSKLSRLYIFIIVTGLLFISGVRFYRTHGPRLRALWTMQQTPVALPSSPVPPVMQLPVFERFATQENTEIYLQDTALPAELNREQARQTIISILDDYKDNQPLQAFYADLRQSTGQTISLADLSGERMELLLKRYPQISQIIEQHAQDPAFSQVLQEIFTNPQFVRSVAVLQQKK